MFKKLLLILSILSISAQNELNAISFTGIRKGTSNQLAKAKDFCWKTGPRKAATLISVSVAFYTLYTLLAAFHNKVHNLQDFWGTFVKQGTHPRKMYELNSLRYDFLVKKRNQLEEVIKQLSEPRDEYIAAVKKHSIVFTSSKKSILTKYNEIVTNQHSSQFYAMQELHSLATVSATSDINIEVKTAAQKFKEAFESATATPFEDHLKSGQVYFTKKVEFNNMPKLPCCA